MTDWVQITTTAAAVTKNIRKPRKREQMIPLVLHSSSAACGDGEQWACSHYSMDWACARAQYVLSCSHYTVCKRADVMPDPRIMSRMWHSDTDVWFRQFHTLLYGLSPPVQTFIYFSQNCQFFCNWFFSPHFTERSCFFIRPNATSSLVSHH